MITFLVTVVFLVLFATIIAIMFPDNLHNLVVKLKNCEVYLEEVKQNLQNRLKK